MGEEEQTLSLVMEERDPAHSEEAAEQERIKAEEEANTVL